LRRSWLAAAVIVATLLALGGQTAIVARTGFLVGDFRAFYCAARVASKGANPYRTQPLGACENSIGPKLFFRKNPGVTIPAPLPGYAIAALVPIARLPFAAAAIGWVLLLLLAWVAGVMALARFAGTNWETALAVLALSLGTLSLPFGEIVPLAVGCTCVAGFAAWRGRWLWAAIFAAGAMVEPHLGLPVCLALAIWAPATRLPLLLCGMVLASASLVLLGPAVNVEYFTSVLPAHALSELTRDTQYSVSALLAAAGLGPGMAIRAGALWYAAMVATGIVVGGRLAQRTGNAAWIVCIPPAFAVFGGTFIHITQIAAAAPAALLLATQMRSPYRGLAAIALLALVVPWGWVVSPALIVAPLVPVAFLAWTLWEGNARIALIAACVAAVMVFGLQHLYTIATPHFGAHAQALAIDPRLPEASWGAYSRRSSGGSLAAWAVRLPTWCALALLVGLFVREARFARVRWSAVAPLALALTCVGVPIALQFSADRASGWLAVDFRAYYCASLAQREERNPYAAQSLHGCEAVTPPPYYRVPANVTVPAPYPPYVLALLAPLTLLPFGAALSLWWVALAASILLGAYALARITLQPVAVGLGALGLSLGLTSFSSGNMMPLGCAAVIAAALALQRGRIALGVGALTIAMLEPQIALPAAAGCFCLYPASRVLLAGAIALLAALSLAGAGLAVSISYLTAVLPAHALAEVSRDNQYSLATIATTLGVPDVSAAFAGTLSYIVMSALGVVVAMRLWRRYEEPALAVLVPPAFSLLGGSFVHTAEIAAAVPAALLLFTRSETMRGWLLAALVLLAVPWMNATSIATFAAPFFPVAYLVYVLWGRDRSLALTAACCSFAAIAGLFVLAASPHAHAATHAHLYPFIDPHLAEASWRQFVLGNSTNDPIMWLLRLPTWCGLLILAFATSRLVGRSRLLLAAQPR